jgi:hypothetical protein
MLSLGTHTGYPQVYQGNAAFMRLGGHKALGLTSSPTYSCSAAVSADQGAKQGATSRIIAVYTAMHGSRPTTAPGDQMHRLPMAYGLYWAACLPSCAICDSAGMLRFGVVAIC